MAITNTFSISAKTRNSIFKILGTAQFELEVEKSKYEYEITIIYPKNKSRGNYVDSFCIWGDENWEKELIKEIYENKEVLIEKMIENKIFFIQTEIDKNKLEKLEEKYNELVQHEEWYYAPDMGFDVKVKEALENDHVWGFKINDANSLGLNCPRHSFVMEIGGAEIIRYCHVENCYYSLVNYDLSEKVDAVNWYEKGYRYGYDSGYYGNIDPDYKEPPLPEFPNSIAEDVFIEGYHTGSYQGYMDT